MFTPVYPVRSPPGHGKRYQPVVNDWFTMRDPLKRQADATGNPSQPLAPNYCRQRTFGRNRFWAQPRPTRYPPSIRKPEPTYKGGHTPPNATTSICASDQRKRGRLKRRLAIPLAETDPRPPAKNETIGLPTGCSPHFRRVQPAVCSLIDAEVGCIGDTCQAQIISARPVEW
jgi:hypothetical protein